MDKQKKPASSEQPARGASQKLNRFSARLLHRWFENDTVVLVLSILSAVLIWFAVAYNTDEKITDTVRNVPVNFDMTTSTLARLDLYPVMEGELTVDVEISGARATVGNIAQSDIRVEAKLNNVTGPGTYEVALDVSDYLGKGFEVKGALPETLTVRFDHLTEKTIEIELEMEGVEIPEGYVLDTEYLYPAEVTVSGPETEVSEIESCRAVLSLKQPLSETETYEVELALYDAEGKEISSPYLNTSAETVSVTLPVLKKKIVPVTFDFINVPSSFDADTLSYDIFPSEIEIAGPENTLSSLTEIHLGYLDLSEFTPEFPVVYSIQLPSGYISIDNTKEAVIAFDAEGYTTTELNISNIRLLNAPDDYDVSVATKMIYGVTICGPEDEIAKLQGTDLVAEIDMLNVDTRVGQSTVGVSVLLPTSPSCWAVGGDYTAVITVKSK